MVGDMPGTRPSTIVWRKANPDCVKEYQKKYNRKRNGPTKKELAERVQQLEEELRNLNGKRQRDSKTV